MTGSRVLSMDEKEQIECFSGDLDKLLERYSDEFDMSLASQVGTLLIKIQELITISLDADDEDDDEEEAEVWLEWKNRGK